MLYIYTLFDFRDRCRENAGTRRRAGGTSLSKVRYEHLPTKAKIRLSKVGSVV